MNSIPVCFYPIKKIILDDDKAFLESITLKLHGKNFLPFSSADEAIHALTQYKPIITKNELSKSLLNQNALEFDRFEIMQFQHTLTQAINNDISILFIDYHMPKINGLEFLEKITNLSIKKALVTGETDYKIGVDAFNAGLVDAYLRKDDPDFLIKIQNLLFELEWKYFTELSNLFLELPKFDFLKNRSFMKLLQKLLKENDIKEFFLMDTYGSFLATDSSNQQKYILLRNKKQLNELAMVAHEDGGSNDVIKKLNEGTAIPFFEKQEYWQIPASQWDGYLYPANKFDDDKESVWTIVNK